MSVGYLFGKQKREAELRRSAEMGVAQVGTVIHGTLRSEDLLAAFATELERLGGDAKLVEEARTLLEKSTSTPWGSKALPDELQETASEIVSDLQDALNEKAPEDHYFGTLEGDASDFGFWPLLNDLEREGSKKVIGRAAKPGETEIKLHEQWLAIDETIDLGGKENFVIGLNLGMDQALYLVKANGIEEARDAVVQKDVLSKNKARGDLTSDIFLDTSDMPKNESEEEEMFNSGVMGMNSSGEAYWEEDVYLYGPFDESDIRIAGQGDDDAAEAGLQRKSDWGAGLLHYDDGTVGDEGGARLTPEQWEKFHWAASDLYANYELDAAAIVEKLQGEFPGITVSDVQEVIDAENADAAEAGLSVEAWFGKRKPKLIDTLQEQKKKELQERTPVAPSTPAVSKEEVQDKLDEVVKSSGSMEEAQDLIADWSKQIGVGVDALVGMVKQYWNMLKGQGQVPAYAQKRIARLFVASLSRRADTDDSEDMDMDKAWEIAEGVAKEWADNAMAWKPGPKDKPDIYIDSEGNFVDGPEGAETEQFIIRTVWNSDGFDHFRDAIQSAMPNTDIGDSMFQEWEIDYEPEPLLSDYLKAPYGVQTNPEWSEGYIVYSRPVGRAQQSVRQHTTDVYTFDELSPEAQAKALEAYRNINVDFDDWSEYVVTYWVDERLPVLGYTGAEISFSGFSSQGDGASFTGTVDIPVVARRLGFEDIAAAVEAGHDLSAKIVRDSGMRYVHQNSTNIDLDIYEENDVIGITPERFKEFQDAVKEDLVSINNNIYKELEDEYYGYQEDESVKETILANDYEFTVDGRPFSSRTAASLQRRAGDEVGFARKQVQTWLDMGMTFEQITDEIERWAENKFLPNKRVLLRELLNAADLMARQSSYRRVGGMKRSATIKVTGLDKADEAAFHDLVKALKGETTATDMGWDVTFKEGGQVESLRKMRIQRDFPNAKVMVASFQGRTKCAEEKTFDSPAILYHDGEEVRRGSVNDLFDWMNRNLNQSWDYEFKYNGWMLKDAESGKVLQGSGEWWWEDTQYPNKEAWLSAQEAAIADTSASEDVIATAKKQVDLLEAKGLTEEQMLNDWVLPGLEASKMANDEYSKSFWREVSKEIGRRFKEASLRRVAVERENQSEEFAYIQVALDALYGLQNIITTNDSLRPYVNTEVKHLEDLYDMLDPSKKTTQEASLRRVGVMKRKADFRGDDYLYQDTRPLVADALAKLEEAQENVSSTIGYPDDRDLRRLAGNAVDATKAFNNEISERRDMMEDDPDWVEGAKHSASLRIGVRRPPKKWWDEMEADVKKKNPSYSDEQVRKTIGDIWYNKLSAKEREKILDREGKGEKKGAKVMADYEGWSNYETWAVNLWLANDQALYNMMRGWVAEVKVEHSTETQEGVYSDATMELSDRIQNYVEDDMPELNSPYGELLNGGMEEVNWREIAEEWIKAE